MKTVAALTPYTCVLACLESFLTDPAVGIGITQCELLKNYPSFCLSADPARRHEFGAMSQAQLMQFCAAIGLNCSGRCQDFRQPAIDAVFSSATDTRAILIIAPLWQNQTAHCVRLHRVVQPGVYEVMNAGFLKAAMETVSFQDLVTWNFEFYIITK